MRCMSLLMVYNASEIPAVPQSPEKPVHHKDNHDQQVRLLQLLGQLFLSGWLQSNCQIVCQNNNNSSNNNNNY